MGGRPIQTRRQWLAACGTAVGAAALAGCTGSDDETTDDSDNIDSTRETNGDETTENGGLGSLSGATWPMSRFTAGNRMVTDDWSGPDGPLEERWTFETDDGVAVSGPVVGHGLVYVAAEDSVLYALDTVTGDVEWVIDRTYPDAPPGADHPPTTPAVSDDAVYFLTDALEAIDPDNGDQHWSVDLGSRPEKPGHIRVYNSTVYVHSDEKLYAVDADTEAIIWEETISEVQHIAVGVDETLYVSHKTNNGHDYEVVAFDIEKDEAVWTYSPPGNVDTGRELMVRDGTVYTHELDTVLAIDGETGEGETIVVYNDDEDESVAAGRSPTIANETIYSGGVFDQRSVLTRDVETGEEPETWDPDDLSSGPTGRRLFVSDDTLYVWRNFGYTHLDALDPETGEQRWTTHTTDHIEIFGARIEGYVLLDDVVIFSANGNLGAISALVPE